MKQHQWPRDLATTFSVVQSMLAMPPCRSVLPQFSPLSSLALSFSFFGLGIKAVVHSLSRMTKCATPGEFKTVQGGVSTFSTWPLALWRLYWYMTGLSPVLPSKGLPKRPCRSWSSFLCTWLLQPRLSYTIVRYACFCVVLSQHTAHAAAA